MTTQTQSSITLFIHNNVSVYMYINNKKCHYLWSHDANIKGHTTLLPQFIIVTDQPLSSCNDKTYLPHKEAGYCYTD